jgi:hypothetical protein
MNNRIETLKREIEMTTLLIHSLKQDVLKFEETLIRLTKELTLERMNDD